MSGSCAVVPYSKFVGRTFRRARFAALVLLALSLLYFLGLKLGWLPPSGLVLACASVMFGLWLVVELIWATILLLRRRLGIGLFLARALLFSGVLLVLGGGLANWAYRLRGFVVMTEGDTALLSHGNYVQEFEAGWLSDPKEMRLSLSLKKVQLNATPSGVFVPASELILQRPGTASRAFELSPAQRFEDGTLRFHHGAFGYAPRIVITKGKETIFDKTVPFISVPDTGKLSFVREFIIEKHQLHVRGEVVLDSLDEEARGHPRLALSVERNGARLGSGVLTLGRFAGLAEDYRIGFAGLLKWAEVDISRRNYPRPMFAGIAMMGVGLLLWAAGLVWHRWRQA